MSEVIHGIADHFEGAKEPSTEYFLSMDAEYGDNLDGLWAAMNETERNTLPILNMLRFAGQQEMPKPESPVHIRTAADSTDTISNVFSIHSKRQDRHTREAHARQVAADELRDERDQWHYDNTFTFPDDPDQERYFLFEDSDKTRRHEETLV